MTDLAPLESIFRPHCRAADRILLWTPSTLPPLPSMVTEEMRARITETRAHSIADSTRSTYGSGLLLFHVFCDMHRISDDQRAPAHPMLIQAFLASIVGGYSASAVSNYLHGVKTWHTIHGVAWLLDPGDTTPLLAAAKRIALDKGIGKPERPAFTVGDLEAICRTLDPTVSLDVSFKFCVTATFWGTARVKKMTVVNLTDDSFHPQHHIQIQHVSNRWDHKMKSQVTVLHPPVTKAAPFKGEDIFFAQQLGPSDPKGAMAEHILLNDPQPGEHLFSHVVRDSQGRETRRPLSRTIFINRLRRACADAGIDAVMGPKGHSLRIGGTLEYLLRGVPFLVVKYQGRWAGDSFGTYLRKHAVVIAPYLQAPASRVGANQPTRTPFPPLPPDELFDEALLELDREEEREALDRMSVESESPTVPWLPPIR
ncbi:hypothetical protein PsYK624_118510 [Phanerochaete sordida]|uniref:Uncharacterized protein n=1 Tax=Phanerochaete sordida TaxID=48140 RepID=A0A9P3LHT3_9APHY|nr:hypothetical protein PsYK624_118510 [Phanerochaete sordida]